MFDDDDDNIDDFKVDDDAEKGQNQPDPNAPAGGTAPAAIDHAAIAATVAQTMQQFQQPAQQQQMSPEEMARHLKVWNPDEGYVNALNKLSDPEVPFAERRKLLDDMRDGIVEQSFRASQLLLERQRADLLQEIQPAIEYAQERQAKKLMGEFVGQFPALKGQDQLVNSITAGLSAQGFRPASKAAAFEKVAEIAESILKGANPQFSLKQQAGTNGMPAMAGTNMGGQTGGFQTSQGSNQPKKRGGLASIFQNR